MFKLRMFCLLFRFGSHRKLDPGGRCPRQPHTVCTLGEHKSYLKYSQSLMSLSSLRLFVLVPGPGRAGEGCVRVRSLAVY